MTPLRTPSVLAAALAGAAMLGAGAAAGAAQTTPAPPPPPAPAIPVSFTFTGHGWGHGVGMSQYGARGRALAGWGAGRILRHYYRGTRLSVVRRRNVRVLLSSGLRTARLWSPTAWRAVGLRAGGRKITALRAGRTYVLRMLPSGRLALELGHRRVGVFTGTMRVQAIRGSRWTAWGPTRPEAARRYRGSLRAVPQGRSFQLVNVVDMEDYIRGVVPREMPASWGDDAPAALAAQAVAARTYALATMKPTSTYDVYDDDRSQVYGGVDAEDPRSDAAVRATRGTVLTYHGAVITAFFFSTSGGRTENVENVFNGSPEPYLVSVPDPYDSISPYHTWPDPPTFTAARLGTLLGLDGPVRDVTVLKRGVSPRVLLARVTTRSGRQTLLSGTTMRADLGLRDTWFSVRPNLVATATRR
jgi:SpoIID/LytB domain protein